MAADDKVFGPKSKALVVKKIRAAERMLKLSEASLETLDYDEDPDDDRPSHARNSSYSERKVIGDIFRAVSKLLDSTAQLIDLYPIDDRADVVELMRRGLRKTEEEEANGEPIGVKS